MRHIYLVFFLLPSITPVSGQKDNGRLFISFGYQKSYTYSKLYSPVTCFGGCTPTSQRRIAFPDFNIIYGKNIHGEKWGMLLGADINTKGWEEEGISEPNPGWASNNTYNLVIKAKYAGIMGGVSYDILTHRKLQVVVGQLLNPELRIKWGYSNRQIVLATRTTMSIQGPIGNSSASFLIAPYFFTGLMRYNVQYHDYPDQKYYTPFGFGLNVGIGLRIRTTTHYWGSAPRQKAPESFQVTG